MSKPTKTTTPTREQQFNKMKLLVEQLHKHCEKHGIEYYLCHEAPQHQILIAGRGSKQLMINIACDLAINHPQAIIEARGIVAKITEVRQNKEKSNIITLS